MNFYLGPGDIKHACAYKDTEYLMGSLHYGLFTLCKSRVELQWLELAWDCDT